MEPITSLPPNEQLPEQVHAVADEWRVADQRVTALQQQEATARRSIAQARNDDAQAVREAVLNDTPLPDGPTREEIARKQLADAERRLPIAEAERHIIGTRLVVALRAGHVREHLVTQAQEAMRAAVADYLAALKEAERLARQAHRALVQSTPLLGFIQSLDSGATTARTSPAHIPGPPSFDTARQHATALARGADALTDRTRPKDRHVRLADGREVHVVASLAADFHRDGKVTAWLDGWPPEQPSPRLSSLPSSLSPTRFIPRSERGDAA
ncbi:hypothetical protein OH738_29415 [Streptomyces hirsutus]|uniref:hypothetical protein n=1 Tax=Streptomyces hirsutus TaxID=35620 RepID=UPI00386FEE4F|nr:hypothetical protein OH738_29415 [Streptomyces hirsutus]